MKQHAFSTVNTKLGDFTLTADEDVLTGIYQNGQPNFPAQEDLGDRISPKAFEEIAVQIHEYLNGQRKRFSIFTYAKGTPFQKKVWRAVDEIPYGETVTYHELAEMVESRASVKSVAQAVAKNPLTLIIPCHRVITEENEEYEEAMLNKDILLDIEFSHK